MFNPARLCIALAIALFSFTTIARAELSIVREVQNNWYLMVDNQTKDCVIGKIYPSNMKLNFIYTADGVHLIFTGLPAALNDHYTVPFVFKGGKQMKLSAVGISDDMIAFSNLSKEVQDLIAYSGRFTIPDIGEFETDGVMNAMTAAMNCFSDNH